MNNSFKHWVKIRLSLKLIGMVSLVLSGFPALASIDSVREAGISKSAIYQPHKSPALDSMFAQLQQAKNEAQALQLERNIWNVWLRSDNRLITSMMGKVFRARLVGDHKRALRLLDYLIIRFPEYSEAWNQRATIHFLNGNFEASLADVEQTLVLEPRHFGAIAGRATIQWKQGNRDLALQSFRRALEIHPFLPRQKILF